VVVSSHGGVGLEIQGAIFNFMFIAGILVCMHRPRDGIALVYFNIEITMVERLFYELD